MHKRVLIISSSPRRNGNSDQLSEAFKKGAVEAGNMVEKIFLQNKKIGFCMACNACKREGLSGSCVIKDDMEDILNSMLLADVIVLASPVYYYNVNAQMKVMIDRTYARFTELKNKEFYFIFSCSDSTRGSIDAASEALRGFTCCLPDSSEKGIIYGLGLPRHGDVAEKDVLKEAYEMGKGV